jgi:eukaryotic-like serine/threonine-protein kinase
MATAKPVYTKVRKKKQISNILALTLLVAIALLANVTIAEAAVSNSYSWLTLQANGQRTGFSETPAPSSNQTFWKFQTEGPIATSPVAASGMVFVASGDGYLYAVNATTGKKNWSVWAGTGLNSPTAADGKVFVTSRAGRLLAFDMHTGNTMWNQSLQGESYVTPLVLGSRVLATGGSTIYAFNEMFGVQLYAESNPPFIKEITNLVDAGDLVVAFTFRNTSELGLRGFEPKNGNGIFSVTLEPRDNPIAWSPALEGIKEASIFAVTRDSAGPCTVFGVGDFGAPRWERKLEGVAYASPANAYGTVYIPTSSYLYALNATDGVPQWSKAIAGVSSSSPALADGKIFFGLDDGFVYAFNASNGDLVWKYQTEGPVHSSPAISDGLLFVGSDDGCLYAIGYPKIQTFLAGSWEGAEYEVRVQSNGTVSDFSFNQSLKQITFNVTGSLESGEFCNISFPLSLLKGSFSMFDDENKRLQFVEQRDASHAYLSFALSNNNGYVWIEGTEAIPEFPVWAVAFLAAVLMITRVACRRGLIEKRWLK